MTEPRWSGCEAPHARTPPKILLHGRPGSDQVHHRPVPQLRMMCRNSPQRPAPVPSAWARMLTHMKRLLITALVCLLLGAALGAGLYWQQTQSAKNEQATRLELELATTRGQVEDWKGKAVDFEKRLSSEAARLQSEFTDARKQLDDQATAAREEAARLQEKITQTSAEFTSRAQAIAAEEAAKAEQTVAKLIEASELQTTALRGVIDQQRQALTAKDQALADAEKRVASMEQRQKELNEQVKDLSKQVKTLSEQVAAMQGLKR